MAAIASQSTPSIAQKKTDASDWFRTLRDEICAVFEAIEDAGRDDGIVRLAVLRARTGSAKAAAAARSALCMVVCLKRLG